MIVGMTDRLTLWERVKLAGRVLTRSAVDDMPEGIRPPSRVADCDPLSLSTVFRGVQVLQTAITGLPIHEMRGGVKLDTVSPLVFQPDVNRSRRDFLADLVASMVLDGNAFVRLVSYAGDVVSCEVLPRTLLSCPTTDKTRPPRACATATWGRITRPIRSCI